MRNRQKMSEQTRARLKNRLTSEVRTKKIKKLLDQVQPKNV